MMTVTRIGVDLATHVFQIHGVDERGRTVWRRRVSRTPLRPFFGNSNQGQVLQ